MVCRRRFGPEGESPLEIGLALTEGSGVQLTEGSIENGLGPRPKPPGGWMGCEHPICGVGVGKGARLVWLITAIPPSGGKINKFSALVRWTTKGYLFTGQLPPKIFKVLGFLIL